MLRVEARYAFGSQLRRGRSRPADGEVPQPKVPGLAHPLRPSSSRPGVPPVPRSAERIQTQPDRPDDFTKGLLRKITVRRIPLLPAHSLRLTRALRYADTTRGLKLWVTWTAVQVLLHWRSPETDFVLKFVPPLLYPPRLYAAAIYGAVVRRFLKRQWTLPEVRLVLAPLGFPPSVR